LPPEHDGTGSRRSIAVTASHKAPGLASWLSARWPANGRLIRLLSLIPALVLLCDSPPAPAGVEPGASRFSRTIVFLGDAAPGVKAEFATTALTELAEVYIAEADLARKQAEEAGGNAKLLGWSRAVDQYASQLMLVLEDVELGYPVALAPGAHGGASVTVADRSIILGHPRPGQQAAFEQRILLDFCGRNDCTLLTARDTSELPIPVSASQVKADWSFTQRGPVCSHAGIALQFDSAVNLAQSRALCAQFLQEAETLASEIAWQQRHGVSVDWDALQIRPTPQRPQHLVLLNEAGDSILATLPLVHGSPALLHDIKPWLKTRYSGKRTGSLSLRAADYGWPDGSP